MSTTQIFAWLRPNHGLFLQWDHKGELVIEDCLPLLSFADVNPDDIRRCLPEFDT